MSKVYMLIGIQGSGKTTYSHDVLKKNNPNAIIISSDQIRNENPDMEEALVFPTMYDKTAKYLLEGIDVIYDATNITKSVRKRFFDELHSRNVKDFDAIACYFLRDVNESTKRVKLRNEMKGERYLPLEVIKDFDNRFEVPTIEEGFKEIIIIDNTKNWNEK